MAVSANAGPSAQCRTRAAAWLESQMFAEWEKHRKREEKQLRGEQEEGEPFLPAPTPGSSPVIALH